MRVRIAAWLLFAGAACSNELAPYGEALVIVDTDAPVPGYVGRMRLDLFSADGATWFESRDVPLRDPRDWPASFSIYTDDTINQHDTLVRIRIYPEGQVRDYHGERFTSRAPSDTPSADAVPPRQICDVPSDCELPRLSAPGATPHPRPSPHQTSRSIASFVCISRRAFAGAFASRSKARASARWRISPTSSRASTPTQRSSPSRKRRSQRT